MNNPFNLIEHAYTEDQIAAIREANELDDLQRNPGWIRVTAFMKGLVDAAQDQLRSVSTSNTQLAIDAIREYQAKHDFHNQILLYIESAIQQREALAPRNQLENLLLQEQMNGNNSFGPGDPGPTESE